MKIYFKIWWVFWSVTKLMFLFFSYNRNYWYHTEYPSGLGSSVGKESTCNAGLIPGLGRYPTERNGNPLQHSCLENPMDGGAWQTRVHGVSRIRRDLSTKPPPPSWGPALSSLHLPLQGPKSFCFSFVIAIKMRLGQKENQCRNLYCSSIMPFINGFKN